MDNNQDEKIRICHILDYKKDIEPFPLVKLYSGVGSGKTTFATRMITGDKECKIPKQNVLIITSRRAKVEETLTDMKNLVKREIKRNGNLSFKVYQTGEEQPDEYREYLKEIKYTVDGMEFSFLSYNKSVVCTNAYISAYLRYVHNPDDETTHIWNKFDTIIVDEVHSLITDSTYQSACFGVMALIKEYLKLYQQGELQECACKHIILMTGTPQPFEKLNDIDFPEDKTNTLIWFDKCENVVPKKIILIDKQTAKQQIQKLLKDGEKVIYFSNHTLSENEAKKEFQITDDIKIGVSFSNDKKRKTLSKEEKDRLNEIDDSLSKCLIPENIKFFVTTSRNKEGININNTDYNNMFVESHLLYDIVQMAGRVRSGVENLFIITDSDSFNSGVNVTDVMFSKKIMVANNYITASDDEANKYLNNEYFENKNEQQKNVEERNRNLWNYLKYIEDKFPYIRYNDLCKKFEFYNIKELAEKLAKKQEEEFCKILLATDEDVKAYFNNYFPNIEVHREETAKAYCKRYLDNLIGKKKAIVLSKSDLIKHTQIIAERFGVNIKSPKVLLHLVDELYNCEGQRDKYILYYGKENSLKKKPMRKSRKR